MPETTNSITFNPDDETVDLKFNPDDEVIPTQGDTYLPKLTLPPGVLPPDQTLPEADRQKLLAQGTLSPAAPRTLFQQFRDLPGTEFFLGPSPRSTAWAAPQGGLFKPDPNIHPLPIAGPQTNKVAAVAAALYNPVAQMANQAVANPASIAPLAISEGGGVIPKIAEGIYAAIAAKQAPEALVRAVDTATDPKASFQDKVSAFADAGYSTAMATGLATHIAKTGIQLPQPEGPAEYLAREINTSDLEPNAANPFKGFTLRAAPLQNTVGQSQQQQFAPAAQPLDVANQGRSWTPGPAGTKRAQPVVVPETPPEAERGMSIIAEIQRAKADTTAKVQALFPEAKFTREQAAALRRQAFPQTVQQKTTAAPEIAATTEEKPNATQKGQVESSVSGERAGDDKIGPPAEAGTGGGVQPAAQEQPSAMPAGPGAATAKAEGEGSGIPTMEDQITGKLAPERPTPPADVSAQAAPVANGMIAALKSAVENVRGFIGGLAGKTFPRTTLKSKQLGELGARWISSRIAARPVAEVFAADAIGDSGVDPRKLGAALTEDNLRSVKKAFADSGQPEKAAAVMSLIGKETSPFKTEEEYQAFLNDPKVKQVIARHIDLWKNVVEPQYKQAMQLDPDVELPTRGLQTGARINLRAVLEHENPRDVVRSVGRGNLMGTMRKKSPFGVQARGTGQAYHVNYYDLMENTFGKQLEIANKNAFENALVEKGQAVIAPPGETVMIDGQKAVPFPLKRQRVILPNESGATGVNQNKNIYVNARLATEYRIAANVDMKPPSLALKAVTGVLNKAALLSGTDATTHMVNLASALMTLPGTAGRLLNDSLLSALPGRPDVPVSIARALVKGFQDNRAQLASLAEIGALKEQYEPTRTPGMRQASQVIQWLDKTTRLALDDTYKRLAHDGLVENSETARREFVNQIGQYNKRAQGYYKRFFRDSGLGPFVTAGTTFNTMGVRAALLDPAVRGASVPAALALRANMAAKLVGTVGTIATLNYLLTKDKKGGGAMGRPGVPLGAVDLGTDDKNGRPRYIALFNMTSAGRGLRVLGLRGIIQAKMQGLPNEVALDSGARDIINSAIAPWAGPPIRFAVGAATGYPTAINVGRQSAVVPPGQSQAIENFKQALIQASPVAAGIQRSQQVGSTGSSEILKSQLPRFTPQPGKPAEMMEDYPAIVRRAQANDYIDDVIGRARKIEPEQRQIFLQQAVDRLENPEDKAKAWREFKYRKVMR